MAGAHLCHTHAAARVAGKMRGESWVWRATWSRCRRSSRPKSARSSTKLPVGDHGKAQRRRGGGTIGVLIAAQDEDGEVDRGTRRKRTSPFDLAHRALPSCALLKSGVQHVRHWINRLLSSGAAQKTETVRYSARLSLEYVFVSSPSRVGEKRGAYRKPPLPASGGRMLIKLWSFDHISNQNKPAGRMRCKLWAMPTFSYLGNHLLMRMKQSMTAFCKRVAMIAALGAIIARQMVVIDYDLIDPVGRQNVVWTMFRVWRWCSSLNPLVDHV